MRYAGQSGSNYVGQKYSTYSATNLGSGTFRISKPKRKKSKLKEIRAKRRPRRSRRN